jgi:hypothetical protein
MKIINFSNLKKTDKKLLFRGGYIDLLDSIIFHKIEFSQSFIWNNMGISYNSEDYIKYVGDNIDAENDFDLTNKNKRDIKVIDAIQFNRCLFYQNIEIKNLNIKYIEFYDCVFEYDFSYFEKEFNKLGIKCKFDNCIKWDII